MPSAPRHAVFLSYARDDGAAAQAIADALRATGIEVWFDQSELRGGDLWDQQIKRQIRECALFIPIISATTNARAEGYFRLEWKLAVDRSHLMADDAPFLVPVVVDDTADATARVPDKFREAQWTRLPPGAPRATFVERIHALLAVGPTRAAAAASSPTPPLQPAVAARAVAPIGGAPRRNRVKWVAWCALALAIAAGAGWYYRRTARLDWARHTALPDIKRLAENGEHASAFALIRQVDAVLPADPALAALRGKVSTTGAFDSTPSGAQVFYKPYRQPHDAWQLLGTTPLKDVTLQRDTFRWRLQKEGYADLYLAGPLLPRNAFTLDKPDARPAGMVRVGGGVTRIDLSELDHVDRQPLEDYFIDQHEVSNREFKEFVDRGGYRDRTHWKQPFMRDGRTLPWEEAMALFRDASGQPGPATWRNGTYAEGEGDNPVTGVSWFEAAAYAEFVGKRLPSIYHWSRAASSGRSEFIVPLSNFGGKGPLRRGSTTGISWWGVHDVAGNAKEWCWNDAGKGRRYILGGCWREPEYMFVDPDAQAPFERAPTHGFRCMKLLSTDALPAGVDDPIVITHRDYAKEQPVPDAVFNAYRALYTYEALDLADRIEQVDDSAELWRKEKVSFSAAYGNERVTAYVFLPKKFKPPYQTVVYYPGGGAIFQRTSDNLELSRISFLFESGRAVIYPVYKGTYERGTGLKTDAATPTLGYRDHVIMWAKDVSRSIDYLESRKDIQREKLAFMGASWGGAMALIMPAVEPRLKVNVVLIGGLMLQPTLPEVDQVNFAPRVTIPTLMLNGRYDFFFPVDSSQRHMVRLVGAPEEHKRHVLYETGHGVPQHQMVKEIVGWLDRYLGPVK